MGMTVHSSQQVCECGELLTARRVVQFFLVVSSIFWTALLNPLKIVAFIIIAVITIAIVVSITGKI